MTDSNTHMPIIYENPNLLIKAPNIVELTPAPMYVIKSITPETDDTLLLSLNRNGYIDNIAVFIAEMTAVVIHIRATTQYITVIGV